MNTSRATAVALVGMGRMGQALALLAPERSCTVVAALDAAETRSGIDKALLNDASVAIEFTEPASAVANAIACMKAGCAVVIGTTGWASQMQQLQTAVRELNGRALWSPNFSMGVQLFLAVAEEAARRVHSIGGFDMHVVETHHAAKKDAPSGTALAIAERMDRVTGEHVNISSVRTGHVPGTHEVLFDAPFEQLRLVHEARDRRVFADGALTAARWLSRVQAPGLYTMRDMITAPDNTEQS